MPQHIDYQNYLHKIQSINSSIIHIQHKEYHIINISLKINPNSPYRKIPLPKIYLICTRISPLQIPDTFLTTQRILHLCTFRNNCNSSKFPQHLIQHTHTFGSTENTMHILNNQKKGPHGGTLLHPQNKPHLKINLMINK